MSLNFLTRLDKRHHQVGMREEHEVSSMTVLFGDKYKYKTHKQKPTHSHSFIKVTKRYKSV